MKTKYKIVLFYSLIILLSYSTDVATCVRLRRKRRGQRKEECKTAKERNNSKETEITEREKERSYSKKTKL